MRHPGRRSNVSSEVPVGETVALTVTGLEAGDALVVSYIAELDGRPAVFLPPLVDAIDAPGVSVYADQPLVEEGPPARRTEKLTFVFEAGGEYTLPGLDLDGWNTRKQQIETAGEPPLAVSVAGPPLATPVQGQDDEPVDWVILADWLALAFAGWWLLSRLLPRFRLWWRAALEQYHMSERYAFKQLRVSLRGNDARQVYISMSAWLDRIAPGMGIRSFVRRYGDAVLPEQFELLSRYLYRNSGDASPFGSLEQPLKEARRRARHTRRSNTRHVLPPRNP